MKILSLIIFISFFFIGCSQKEYQIKPYEGKPVNEKLEKSEFSFIGSSDDDSFGKYTQINIAKKNALETMYKELIEDHNTTKQFLNYALEDRKEFFWFEDGLMFFGIMLNKNSFLDLLEEYNLNIERR